MRLIKKRKFANFERKFNEERHRTKAGKSLNALRCLLAALRCGETTMWSPPCGQCPAEIITKKCEIKMDGVVIIRAISVAGAC